MTLDDMRTVFAALHNLSDTLDAAGVDLRAEYQTLCEALGDAIVQKYEGAQTKLQ